MAVSLTCPLCCTETFSNRTSLKYHLLSVVDNILCSSCNRRCDSILELIEHLDKECGDHDSLAEFKKEPQPNTSESQINGEKNPESEVVFVDPSRIKTEDEHDMMINNDALEEGAPGDPNLQYSCQICNISFNSIEGHLAKYHEGEEVLLETDSDYPSEDAGQTDENIFNEESMYGDSQGTENESEDNSIQETVSGDKNDNNTDNEEPLTHKYLFDGELKKLTDEEAANIDDKSKIIEIHCCPRCTLQFPNLGHYNKHKCTKSKLVKGRRRHPKAKEDTRYRCAFCQSIYMSLIALNDHMKSHLVQDESGRVIKKTITLAPHVCEVCNTQFPSFKSLRLHKRMHDPVQQKEVKHERIHTGEKPHICQICGKSFRVSYCLTLHMRTHSGTRPYECQQCNKRFKSYSVYNHHMMTHSDERNYKCPFCPKAFKTSVQLAGHKNSHTKPFTCTECNRPFASLYAVRAHMETHKRDNNLKYDCWLCGATYARSFALRDHMNTVHLKDNSDGPATGEHNGENVLIELEQDGEMEHQFHAEVEETEIEHVEEETEIHSEEQDMQESHAEQEQMAEECVVEDRGDVGEEENAVQES